MDAADHAALEGAVFELFLDKACTKPLYVIPTGVEGVYVYDDLKSVGQAITGQNKTTAREDFEDYLDAYLNGKEQNNVVVSPRNGKLVVTGLKSGTYYVKETTPPSGYNSLTGVIEITAGNTDNRFYIYASEQGVVEDIQAPTSVYLEKEFIVEVADVYNSQGVELPSTGGEGTFWMITIGTLLAIGFAVFLITHKKMSVYTD
jgi:LPXTG-motif cell wall-anchored protein